MKKTQLLAFFNLLALAIHITVAYMTQSRLINEKNVGQVSDRYNSLFTPADITFGIWGVIYTGYSFFVFIISEWLQACEVSSLPMIYVQRIGPWFILNNFGAAAWLLIWTKEMIAAFGWAYLFSACYTYCYPPSHRYS